MRGLIVVCQDRGGHFVQLLEQVVGEPDLTEADSENLAPDGEPLDVAGPEGVGQLDEQPLAVVAPLDGHGLERGGVADDLAVADEVVPVVSASG